MALNSITRFSGLHLYLYLYSTFSSTLSTLPLPLLSHNLQDPVQIYLYSRIFSRIQSRYSVTRV